jgi:hypothetical protein
MVVKHRRMIGNPRYGRIGLVALPYFVLFELFGPVFELVGLLALGLSAATGAASPQMLVLMMTLALTYGFVISFATLLMEERAFRRYPGWRCLGRLVVAALVESFGYRQVMTFVRARALWTVRRSRGTWGEMTRVGFEPVQTQ